jgi:hypothetical protein
MRATDESVDETLGASSEKQQASKATSPQERILSAIAVAGIESILKEVSEGEIDSGAGITKIRTLLNEHNDQNMAKKLNDLQ